MTGRTSKAKRFKNKLHGARSTTEVLAIAQAELSDGPMTPQMATHVLAALAKAGRGGMPGAAASEFLLQVESMVPRMDMRQLGCTLLNLGKLSGLHGRCTALKVRFDIAYP